MTEIRTAEQRSADRRRRLRMIVDAIQLISSLGSLAGFGYLVADLRFQSAPSIVPAASDPKDPFRFPFLLVNNSHLGSLHDVSWTCHVDEAVLMDRSQHRNMATPQSSPGAEIGPGNILNLQCANVPELQHSAIREITISIEVSYTSDTIPFISKTARQQASFRWYADASMPQWIKQ